MRNAFSDALVAAALSDPKVLLLTGDHGYALFDAFRKARPEQYINCGIAEQNMVGVAAGLAKAGFKPIVYGLAAFVPVRVLEQIKIDVCYENLPVILIGDGAGLVYGQLGTSHQSTEDIACTRAIPSLTVLSPADRFEMTATMELALKLASPVYLRVGKSDRGDVHTAPLTLRGAGEMLRVGESQGRVALLATGSMVRFAMDLIAQGLAAEIWSVPSIKPIDREQLRQLTGRVDAVVTLEEHSVMGGLGACIAEELAASPRPLPLCRIGVEDRFSAFCGSWDYLLQEHKIDPASVAGRVGDFLAALGMSTTSPQDRGS
ncbi:MULTISPECIES: transketolase C-terminal domain-containing protein [unclassified Polaromonas]|jgi:transketolase|uniref:transketolase family protein n=1 Tax=unclassified Polaromonas TaxID=2638319 RepID=UPI000BC82AED|nr:MULTISPECIES: transketolase C-terminal domain-containing protein [unclassified Polaromonas]OYY39781.1 MAG: transketolase [Polaromonas sp. 35-63-35]OYZ22526.1 MAG: transketolase [Polaromonas sp. 16-63-31]OYZ81258.1 MAG: transketolase [Polaromonas sp. 24-63-21]OZA52521.1 MAG: transketolase [Polaromonas sp. 17-63-33]OZA88619.1 MAG: transketolase [Polaromonas sp. 39-63-25]